MITSWIDIIISLRRSLNIRLVTYKGRGGIHDEGYDMT